jgi:hypothetical protein
MTKKRKSSSQDKINLMVLDILEDIIGLSTVWNIELTTKVKKLNQLTTKKRGDR